MNRFWVVPAVALVSMALPGAAWAGDAAKGKAVFTAQCSICHRTAANAPPAIGPNLFRVVGRKAGTLAGYSYSPAMKAFGKPWTPAQIGAYLAAPQTVVKGNKMPFAGIKDAAKRNDVVAYMATLK